MRSHEYDVHVEWTGNRGTGTDTYRSYARDHLISIAGLPGILGSADPTFRGDAGRHNPEQLLVAALAQCHMLSYLHQAVTRGVAVTAYSDDAHGTMQTHGTGGAFVEVVLRPRVEVQDQSMVDAALDAHTQASKDCFIAASVNFPVRHEPVVVVDGAVIEPTGSDDAHRD